MCVRISVFARWMTLTTLLLVVPVALMSATPPEIKTLAVLDGEVAGDLFASWFSGSADLNGDGYSDIVVSSQSNDAGGNDAGRVYVYLGGPALDIIPDLVITGAASDRLSASTVGDVNADGFDDFMVGAIGQYGTALGRADLYFGGATLDATPDLIFNGETPGDYFGLVRESIGDFNADGFEDFVIGAPWWPNKQYWGKAYVYFGGPGIDNVADLVISGPGGGEFTVQSCPGDDVNGDGYSDMLIGAYKSDLGGFDSGGAWAFFGGPGADNVPDMAFAGEGSLDWYGSPLDRGGDVNGDGFGDILIGGRQGYDPAASGYAHVHFGGPGLDNMWDLRLSGEATQDRFGAIGRLRDLNGDGYDDFAIGALTNDDAGNEAGKVYVYYGGPGLDDVADLTMTGEAAGDRFGSRVLDLGDVNGDGRPDFGVAAPYTGDDVGRLYVFTFAPTFALDIKPRSCPNPMNAKLWETEQPQNAKSMKGGVLPVAILGGANGDVLDIDLDTVLLEGVAPLRGSYENVTAPAGGNECECVSAGPDDFMDLTLKFRKMEIVAAMGTAYEGETYPLTLTGILLDGTPFELTDCVVITGKRDDPVITGGPSQVVLNPVAPNPFNPVTRISYVLPHENFVTLSVFSASGKLTETLVSAVQSPGEHVITWDAKSQPSGVYFCRIVFGGVAQTRKMILLK